MNRVWCCTVDGGIRLAVQVMPNAKKNEVIGLFDDMLKIRLQAQPIEGKANNALTCYLADVLNVPKTAVSVTHGHTGKRKIVEISAGHLTVIAVQQMLLPSESGASLST